MLKGLCIKQLIAMTAYYSKLPLQATFVFQSSSINISS